MWGFTSYPACLLYSLNRLNAISFWTKTRSRSAFANWIWLKILHSHTIHTNFFQLLLLCEHKTSSYLESFCSLVEQAINLSLITFHIFVWRNPIPKVHSCAYNKRPKKMISFEIQFSLVLFFHVNKMHSSVLNQMISTILTSCLFHNRKSLQRTAALVSNHY